MNKKFRLDLIITILICLISFPLIIFKPVQLTIVSGNSMSPTLYNGELLLLTKGSPIKNDIVTFNAKSAWNENNLNRDFIKRVVGVPGDEIKIEKNKLYINNNEIVDFEGKIKNKIGNHLYKLKEYEYFVTGDNTGNSHDSLLRLLSGETNYVVNKKLLNYKLSNIENKRNK